MSMQETKSEERKKFKFLPLIHFTIGKFSNEKHKSQIPSKNEFKNKQINNLRQKNLYVEQRRLEQCNENL